MTRRAASLSLALCLSACAHAGVPADEGRVVSLYFGRDSPSGLVSEEAFAQFEEDTVSPAFPSGYSLFEARGHYREPDGDMITEPTYVFVVVFTNEAEARAASERIDAIRRAYCERFQQYAVLRIDTRARVSFNP